MDNSGVRTSDDDVELCRGLSGGVGGRDLDLAGTLATERLESQRRLSLGGRLDDHRGRRGQRLVLQSPVHLGGRNPRDLYRNDEARAGLDLLGGLQLRLVVDRRRRYTPTTPVLRIKRAIS